MSYFIRKEIHVEIGAGSVRDGVFREMLKLSEGIGVPVVAVFNGVVVRTQTGDDLVALTERWQKDFDHYRR